MYSAEVNYWSFRAARHILKKESIDLMYLSTTDYMMHTYAPDVLKKAPFSGAFEYPGQTYSAISSAIIPDWKFT